MSDIMENIITEETNTNVEETNIYKQIRINKIAVMALSGMSQIEIARETKLSDDTIRAIQNDPQFQKTIQLASSKIFDSVIAKLSLASSTAAQFLIDVLDNPNSNDRIRLQAAKIILDLSAQAKNAALEQRLEALEEALSQDNPYA